jgi:hypothetical protein
MDLIAAREIGRCGRAAGPSSAEVSKLGQDHRCRSPI